jgi:hypothetical protein
MTPEERRANIIRRQMEGGFTNFQIVQESGYQGYPHYKTGTDAGDKKVYTVEQAIGRLEAKKD